MTPTRTVQSTWLAMLALQTIGSVDAERKLPAPRQYVAIGVLWGILFLAADTGFGKIAARFSVLVLLTGAVLGPFGKRAVDFLNMISQRFTVAPSGQGATGVGATGGSPPADVPAPFAPAPAGPILSTN